MTLSTTGSALHPPQAGRSGQLLQSCSLGLDVVIGIGGGKKNEKVRQCKE